MARGLGLEQTVPFAANWEDEIRKANFYYASKGFEYFEVNTAVSGYPQLPALDESSVDVPAATMMTKITSRRFGSGLFIRSPRRAPPTPPAALPATASA